MTDTVGDDPVRADVDLGAIRANVGALLDVASPAAVLAVVKANAYGHGAVPVARAVLDAGASWLGVARVAEGAQLREGGIEAPIMLLSEAAPWAAPAVVAWGLTPVVYTAAGIDALAKAVADAGGHEPLPVHLKVDTGMHRVGCAPGDAVALGELVAARDELVLGGVCTHLALADQPADPYTREQLARFDALLGELGRRVGRPGVIHAANSAALLAFPEARYDLVRVGIAVYGVPPAPTLDGAIALRPALSLRSWVTHVKTLDAGARVSYGLRYELAASGRIATVPAGYADGVPRNLGLSGGQVLLRGRRYPIAGVVTMDQLMVDVGDDPVEPGDEVVLVGRQGDEQVTATEWAERLGTIAYEVVTGIGPRVPRRYVS